MEIPQTITKEINQVTVLLSQRKEKDYKQFRCMLCGKILFEYNNEFIRHITPSGFPELDRPSKVIQCGGEIGLYAPRDLYGILFDISQAIFETNDIEEARNLVKIANDSQVRTSKCKMRYFVT